MSSQDEAGVSSHSAWLRAEKQFLQDYLRQTASLVNQRIEQLDEEINRAQESESLEERLEALPWVQARSGKCDYVKDAPAELVEAVRSGEDGVRGAKHHFTVAKAEPTLFRFERRAE